MAAYDNSTIGAVNNSSLTPFTTNSNGPDPSVTGVALSRLQGGLTGTSNGSAWRDSVDVDDPGAFAHESSLADSWGLGPQKNSSSSSDDADSSTDGASANSNSNSNSSDNPADPNNKTRKVVEKAEGEVRDGGQPAEGYDDLEREYQSTPDRSALSQAMVMRVEGALTLGRMHRDSKRREDSRNRQRVAR